MDINKNILTTNHVIDKASHPETKGGRERQLDMYNIIINKDDDGRRLVIVVVLTMDDVPKCLAIYECFRMYVQVVWRKGDRQVFVCSCPFEFIHVPID